MKIKICGLTRREDVECAVEQGADILGFILAPSPRRISPRLVCELTEHIPSTVLKAGVFVNEDIETVKRTADQCGLDLVQLHGDETPDYCSEIGSTAVKAFRVRGSADIEQLKNYPCSLFLLDAFVPGSRGGTGTAFDHTLACEAKQYGNIIVAGGLTPDNVGRMVRAVRPWGCDVSSGVEKDKGIKDHTLIARFVHSAREEI